LRKGLRHTLTSLIALGMISTGASLADDPAPSDRLGEIKQQIQDARDAIDTINKSKSSADNDAKDLSSKLVATARKVQALEEQDNKITGLLRELDDTITAREEALNAQDEDMQETLAALTRVGRRPETVNISSPAPLIDKVRAAAMMRYAVPRIEEKAQTLAAQLTELARQKQAQQDMREELADSREALNDKRTKLAKMLDDRKSTSEKLTQELSATQTRIAGLETQARDLQDLLKRIEADRLRKEQEAAIAAARAAGKPTAPRPNLRTMREAGPATRPNLRTADSRATTQSGPRPELTYEGDFGAQKGRLRLPARGSVIKAYGSHNSSTDGTEKGITFRVANGAQVTASAPGKVVYAGPFRSLGGLVIINVGQGYHLLIAGLTQIDVTVGQTLLAGEPVGIVMPQSRHTDWQQSAQKADQPNLYVEIRRDGKPVNPAYWFTKQDRQFAGLL